MSFTTAQKMEIEIKPKISEESKAELQEFLTDIGDYFDGLTNDIITNTKTVIKDTYDASVKLVDA